MSLLSAITAVSVTGTVKNVYHYNFDTLNGAGAMDMRNASALNTITAVNPQKSVIVINANMMVVTAGEEVNTLAVFQNPTASTTTGVYITSPYTNGAFLGWSGTTGDTSITIIEYN